MGIKSPRGVDLYRQATGEYDRTVHGRRSATLYCEQGHTRGTVGEVRGRAVFGNYGPYDLWDSNEDVHAHCKACPAGSDRYIIELSKLRVKIREPQRGQRKINLVDVARRAHQQAWGFAGYVRHHISKPTIAAVNGTALGGGTEIVLASDLAVAADSAIFGLPEVKRGILAAAGGVIRLHRQIPMKRALEMILTGDPIDAATALDLGLVNQVTTADRLMATALELAQRIAVNAPLSVQASKRISRGIRDGVIQDEAAAWEQNAQEALAIRGSADAKEGPLAFAEKRAPQWLGR